MADHQRSNIGVVGLVGRPIDGSQIVKKCLDWEGERAGTQHELAGAGRKVGEVIVSDLHAPTAAP